MQKHLDAPGLKIKKELSRMLLLFTQIQDMPKQMNQEEKMLKREETKIEYGLRKLTSHTLDKRTYQ